MLETTRICCACKVEKDLELFYRSATSRLGRKYQCAECSKSSLKAYRARQWENSSEYREMRRTETQKHYAENPEYYYFFHIRKKFNLSEERWSQMIEEQDGKCKICKGTNANGQRLAVDHDHKCCDGNFSCGECIRGLICQPCNHGLGSFRDNRDTLLAAIQYLEEYENLP